VQTIHAAKAIPQSLLGRHGDVAATCWCGKTSNTWGEFTALAVVGPPTAVPCLLLSPRTVHKRGRERRLTDQPQRHPCGNRDPTKGKCCAHFTLEVTTPTADATARPIISAEAVAPV
jgi:hypothetical protein